MLLTKCKGINIDAKNNLGFTPLMKAALQGRTKTAKLLLFAGKYIQQTESIHNPRHELQMLSHQIVSLSTLCLLPFFPPLNV